MIIMFENKKMGRANFSDFFMNLEIAIGKQWKGNSVIAAVKIDFVSGIACTNADDLQLSAQVPALIDERIQLVDPGCFALANGAIHAEYLHDNDLGGHITDCEGIALLDAKIVAFNGIRRQWQGENGPQGIGFQLRRIPPGGCNNGK